MKNVSGLAILPIVMAIALAHPALTAQTKPAAPAPAGPVLVFETVKGTFEIQLFPDDAPKSVAHITELVRKNFYRSQRIHRVTASLAQFGDPKTRDMTLRDYWGSGGSGSPINAFEVSKRRTHVRGAVGLGYAGSPNFADSQLYIMKTASPSLDGKYAVIGRVTSGMTAVDKLEVTDLIKLAYVKGEGPK